MTISEAQKLITEWKTCDDGKHGEPYVNQLLDAATILEKQRIKEKYGTFNDGCGCCSDTGLSEYLDHEDLMLSPKN